jgi:hypothetical protein
MPRKARLEFLGAFYHLLERGDRREAIFRGDRDRKRSQMKETVEIRRLGFPRFFGQLVRD